MQSGQVTDTAAGGALPDDDVIYQILTFGADYTVDGLIVRFDRGDIYRPEFQRAFVWTLPQASKFIESILLGLPIPSVFLYREEESQQHLIVDGLQRLTTLHAFFKGVFPTNERAFRLKNVKPRFENKALGDLSPEDQRRFADAVIHAMIIQQAAPQNDKSSVFHIFERLNSNGTPLEPQEIRSAIYHGPFQSLLYELNREGTWRAIFGPIHKRSKDEELILRFLAFVYDSENYVSPMKLFLNNFMGKNRQLQMFGADEAYDVFLGTLLPIYEALGDRAFRITKSLNAAIFDSFMVAVARNGINNPKIIKDAYKRLLRSADYQTSVSKATANPRNVEDRMRLADEAVRAAI
jgi:hypothetical protein